MYSTTIKTLEKWQGDVCFIFAITSSLFSFQLIQQPTFSEYLPSARHWQGWSEWLRDTSDLNGRQCNNLSTEHPWFHPVCVLFLSHWKKRTIILYLSQICDHTITFSNEFSWGICNTVVSAQSETYENILKASGRNSHPPLHYNLVVLKVK